MKRIYRHQRRGSLYKVIAEGLLEVDKTPVVVYKSLTDGQVWVRPSTEFFDGRFVLENAR